MDIITIIAGSKSEAEDRLKDVTLGFKSNTLRRGEFDRADVELVGAPKTGPKSFAPQNFYGKDCYVIVATIE